MIGGARGPGLEFEAARCRGLPKRRCAWECARQLVVDWHAGLYGAEPAREAALYIRGPHTPTPGLRAESSD